MMDKLLRYWGITSGVGVLLLGGPIYKTYKELDLQPNIWILFRIKNTSVKPAQLHVHKFKELNAYPQGQDGVDRAAVQQMSSYVDPKDPKTGDLLHLAQLAQARRQLDVGRGR